MIVPGQEAEQRGLLNLKPEALPALIDPKNVELFARHRVFTEHELHSRYEILLENYSKTINIEALTMIDMVNRQVLPAVLDYQNELAELIIRKKQVSADIVATPEEKLLKRISGLADCLYKRLEHLTAQTSAAREIKDNLELARACHEKICTAMNELRQVVDELETIVDSKHWRIPTYAEILYSVHE